MFHPIEVCGLTSIDLALRRSKDHQLMVKNQSISIRILEAVVMNGRNTDKKPAPLNQTFDPYRMRKRRVPRGSDPIHNKA